MIKAIAGHCSVATARDVLPSSAASSGSSTSLADIDPQLWLRCWSCMDGRARVVVTAGRVLLWAEDKARGIFACEKELRLRERRIELSNAAEMPRFELFLSQVDDKPRTFVPASGNLLLRAARLTMTSGMPLIGLSFWDTGAGWEPKWADIDAIFGLTASEGIVIRLLFRGVTAEGIAQQQKLSIDTVRTHIRHAYGKMFISHREGLWRRLAPFRIN
jgi:DNA-binding CsgD family transcriptional regulator